MTLSKALQCKVEARLAVAGHYGLDPQTTTIPAVAWVCSGFDALAAAAEFRLGGLRENDAAQNPAGPSSEWYAKRIKEEERIARRWRKWSAEVRTCGIPADLLAKYGWRP